MQKKNFFPHKTSTQIFTAPLSITIPNWKQTRYPLIGEWINKLYIHTVEYYSEIKKNELSNHVKIWMNLKSRLLIEKRCEVGTVIKILVERCSL